MTPTSSQQVACALLLMTLAISPRTQCYIIREDESFLQQPHYQTQAEIEDLFASLAKAYPEMAKVVNIGHSSEGRNLVVLQIGRNVRHRSLLTPNAKYIANMHGDETVGRQLLVYLAKYLLFNYQTNSDVARLINSTVIDLMPTMNPDGFARSQEGNCESLNNYVGRTNAAGVDLNRDFPDRLDSQPIIQLRSQTRQPETAALVEWIVSKPFVLSANFHGGAVVASYPYDNSIAHRECCTESLTPDDRVFKLMAHTYADSHPLMRNGHNCNDSFADGVTNGANWYELNGGMQDFNYAFSNCFELTIELSCCKFPPAATLPEEWARNKRSLLQLLKLAHIGVKGLVKDASGYPIHDARILVSGLEEKAVRTTSRGEYWRLLTPGLYSVQAIAFGYQPSFPQQIHVQNDRPEALRLDFILTPLTTNYDGAFRKLKIERAEPSKLEGGFSTPTKFVHHNNTEMEKFLRNIGASFPEITRLYSIGKSVENRDLWVMEIFATPGEHIPGIPEFKYVANMHGNEVVGREMLLLLTKYLCENYLVQDRITRLLNTTRLHFLYSMNPDGYERAHEGDKSSGVGRGNAHEVDLNRNFPDQYGTDQFNNVTEPEVLAVMKWTLTLPFVLSANLHGGSLVANYPFDDNANDFVDPVQRMRFANVKERKMNPTDENEMFEHLALVYSKAHPSMHLGSPCPLFKNEVFPQGIVNGAQWYSVTGGMQDWNYVHAGVMELTLELGCDKFPMAAELPKYWADNREPLIKYMEQVHYGVHGFIRSSIGHPVAGAMITLDGSKHATYSATYGDYWKLALPGRHNITVLSDGFTPQREEIEIPANGERSIRLDVTLMRDDPQHWASANDYRIIENVVHTRYHNNAELRQKLADFETHNGQIATFAYAESEFGFYYNTVKLTADIGAPEENKYKILIVSSLFDSASPLGREITMNLARHVIEGYKIREPPVIKLLERSVLYFLPIRDNFDQVYAMFNKNNSVCDPVIGKEFGERLLSGETEKRRQLFLQFVENTRFDLMLTFMTGSSELSYPKSELIVEKLAHNVENTEFNFSPLKCPDSATRLLQREVTERLTSLFFNMYATPMFSLGLSCCSMPTQQDIAMIWRKNVEKLKNFLHLIDTGVTGHVQDAQRQPLRDANVRLIGHKSLYNVTKNAARFQIILPDGEYTLELNCRGYETKMLHVVVEPGQVNDVGRVELDTITLITGSSSVKKMGEAVVYPSNSAAAGTATITGYVLDVSNHPIANAKVSVSSQHSKQLHLRNFSDSMGAYSIAHVPMEEVTVDVEAPRYLEATRLVHVDAHRAALVRGVVFRLKLNEYVWGMPRLLFIMVASVVCILLLVVCVLCVQFLLARRHRTDKPYYNFSLLRQKGHELFEDDAEGETELFRSPIKEHTTVKPYYDFEADLAEADSDSDSCDDFNDSAEEIVMLDKR